MARSHSIWVVVGTTDEMALPLACFTVKHELITWLKRRLDVFPHERTYLDVLKYHDNPYTTEMMEDVYEWSVEEFLRMEGEDD